MNLKRWKPSVARYWLLLVAGVAWSAVGALLCVYAYGWLHLVPFMEIMSLALAGVILASAIYRFAFSRLAFKNIGRIGQMTEKACLFAFQTWKSYLITLIMVGLGIALRHSAVPKPELAVLYLGIGGGLLLSSLHYYARLLQTIV